MIRVRVISVALFLALASSPALAAWSTSPGVNLPVTLSTGGASDYQMIPDGTGGAFVVWADGRNLATTGNDIYAAHILGSGSMDPAWPVNGLGVCTAAADQGLPIIIADNAGGCIVAWQDPRGATWDIYAERLNANGTIAAGWQANGKLVGATTPSGLVRDDNGPMACSDGAGGIIVTWTVTYTPNSDYDVYAVRYLANGSLASGWVTGGTVVNGNGGYQDSPVIAIDGAGGAIIAYRDGNPSQIRYRTVSASGGVTTPSTDYVAQTGFNQSNPIAISDGQGGMFLAWRDAGVSPDGLAVSQITPAGPQGSPFYYNYRIFGIGYYCFPVQLVADGNGGVYVAWKDASSGEPVHLTHVTGNAKTATGWTTTGMPIGSYRYAGLVADGTGGVLATYSDYWDVYGIHCLANGAYATGWTGTDYLSNAPYFQNGPTACSDGTGGMIALWNDNRDSYRGLSGFYAQRVDRFGALGDAGAQMAGVKDVPNDQGGKVRVSWNPSYRDAEPTHGIANYYVYRQVPTHMALVQLGSGRSTLAAAGSHVAGALRATTLGTATYYWEQIATVPAQELSGYSYVAATTADSVPGSNPYTPFMVEATAYSGAFWFSTPDSGYSKDNLPPLPPAPASATYSPSATAIHWSANAEADLATYRVYRGPTTGFTPGPSNLIASPTDTTYANSGNTPYVYKISAVDAHGNESAFTTVTPSGMLAAPIDGPHEVAFALTSPNPAPRGASFRLALPRAGSVRLALYDALGRRVRTLLDASAPAGETSVRWDGADDAGRTVSSGLYFARLETDGRSLVRRLVLAR